MPRPFPKWVGWLSLFAGLIGPGGALAGIVPPKYGLIVGGASGIILSLTHSLNGTGGATPK